MKTLLPFFLLLAIFVLGVRAQPAGYPGPGLSPEEVRLLQAYRRDPEPFRRVLREQEARMVNHPQHPLAGPRDVIDVTIDNGSVSFYGKNYAYDPVSFRIIRGQSLEVVFRRQRSSFETRVVVSYRPDGLHFDVPDQRPGTQAPERGLFVLPEDRRWEKGEAMEMTGRISSGASRSRADHLVFHVRYALAR